MHSRIFQIESYPVSEDDYICMDTIPDWFTNSIADYVADIADGDREEEIEWLMGSNFGKVCRRDGDKLTFNIDVGGFFDGDFEQFKKVLEDLSKIDFNQFVSGHKPGAASTSLEFLMSRLREAYDDHYGFYIYHDDELYTMQQWVRRVEPCGVYYLGGVVDYHF